jgi:hypothetical protein
MWMLVALTVNVYPGTDINLPIALPFAQNPPVVMLPIGYEAKMRSFLS